LRNALIVTKCTAIDRLHNALLILAQASKPIRRLRQADALLGDSIDATLDSWMIGGILLHPAVVLLDFLFRACIIGESWLCHCSNSR
jgi:hypothetical protein